MQKARQNSKEVNNEPANKIMLSNLASWENIATLQCVLVEYDKEVLNTTKISRMKTMSVTSSEQLIESSQENIDDEQSSVLESHAVTSPFSISLS